MADPNQQGGGGGDQQNKNKGGGGGSSKEGVSLAGNINAANMVGGWPVVKKSIADHSLNAFGFIVAGIGIFMLKGLVYSLLGVDEAAAKPPKPNAWQGAEAIREMKANQPDKFAVFAEKNKDIFQA